MTALEKGVIELTATDGKTTHIIGNRVVRIRGANERESELSAKTRIDWAEFQFVREDPDVVVGKVAAELPGLARFASPNGGPVWADGKTVIGPVRVFPSQRPDGAQSAILIQGARQYLSNTPEEVIAIIKAAGGKPFPVPAEVKPSEVPEVFSKMLSPTPVWD